MRFPLPSLATTALGATVPASLAAGWATDHFVLGAGGAFAGLCALAVQQTTLRKPSSIGADDASSPPTSSSASSSPRKRITREPTTNTDDLAQRLIDQGRYALMLRPQIASTLDGEVRDLAQQNLDEAMAVVPQGPVAMRSFRHEELPNHQRAGGERLVQVEGYLLDRYPVTNAQYQQFVDDGGYEQMPLWDEAIWPAVLGFVDKTGQPGPRFWENGEHPSGKEDHPVTGVCWYEAAAYARWAGKRLPTDPEWVKAGSWPVPAEGGHMVQRKYPWGDAMNRGNVRLWQAAPSSANGTVPVTATPASASVNGIQQLVGNVWEWTSSSYGAWEPPALKVETAMPMKSLRGGAFDTYFETQCTCQFQSGESPLARKHNIGFRCAVGFCDLVTDEVGADEPELVEA